MINKYAPPFILIPGTIGNILSIFIFFKLGRSSFSFTGIRPPRRFTTRNDNGNFNGNGLLSSQNSAQNSVNTRILTSDSNENITQKTNYAKASNRRVSIYVFFLLLGLFDLGVLLFGLLNDWIDEMPIYNLKNRMSIACKLFTFLSYFCSHCSSTLMIIISAFKFNAIYNPLRARSLTKMKLIYFIIASMLCFYFLFNIHVFWSYYLADVNKNVKEMIWEHLKLIHPHLNDSSKQEFLSLTTNKSEKIIEYKCKSDENLFMYVWSTLDKLVFCILPFLSVLILNILIIIYLSKAQKRRNDMMQQKNNNANNNNNNKSNINTTTTTTTNNNNNNTATTTSTSCNNNLEHNYSMVTTKPIPDNKLRIQNVIANNQRILKLTEEIQIDDIIIQSDHSSPRSRQKSSISGSMINRTKKQTSNDHNLVGKRFSIMLLSITFSFLILTFPLACVYTIKEYITKTNNSDLLSANKSIQIFTLVVHISRMLMYINHSINFFIYFVTGSIFRGEFFKILRLILRIKKPIDHGYN